MEVGGDDKGDKNIKKCLGTIHRHSICMGERSINSFLQGQVGILCKPKEETISGEKEAKTG